MDLDYKLRELLESQIANALKVAEEDSKPQLQSLILRVRAAKDSEEMTRLTQEAAEVLGRQDGAATWRGRWNIVKNLFKR
jgi:hypothetical protein